MTGYASSTGVWRTGDNLYARNLALPTGSIEARDLRPGDTLLRRPAGQTERVPMTIETVWGEGRDVVVVFLRSVEQHRISKNMRVALA